MQAVRCKRMKREVEGAGFCSEVGGRQLQSRSIPLSSSSLPLLDLLLWSRGQSSDVKVARMYRYACVHQSLVEQVLFVTNKTRLTRLDCLLFRVMSCLSLAEMNACP